MKTILKNFTKHIDAFSFLIHFHKTYLNGDDFLFWKIFIDITNY